MKILILNWRDIKNPAGGGAEVLTHEMAKDWVLHGHSVTQFSSEFADAKRSEIVDGVEIIRKGNADFRKLFTSVHFYASLYYLKYFRGKFDIVIDEIHGIPFFTPLYVREKKLVLICEVAGQLWYTVFGKVYGTIGRLMEKIYLRILYRNMYFLTISESTKKDLIRESIHPNNITVVPMGISIPSKLSIKKKEKKPTFIFVGRLSKAKGIEDTILAFSIVIKHIPDALLWIVGRGDKKYVTALKRMSQKLRLSNKIVFFDFVTQTKKFELMSRAHILLFPSVKEGWGLTVPEAGLVGTPSIVYNTDGLYDVLQNNTLGIVTKENSPQALADEIIHLYKEEKKYKRLLKKIKPFKKPLKWSDTANTALQVIKKLNEK